VPYTALDGPTVAYVSVVTIRIMQGRSDTANVLHVVGWLKAEDAEELLRVALAAGPGLELNLSDLKRADASGIKALRALADRDVRLARVPQLIALMLERASA